MAQYSSDAEFRLSHSLDHYGLIIVFLLILSRSICSCLEIMSCVCEMPAYKYGEGSNAPGGYVHVA